MSISDGKVRPFFHPKMEQMRLKREKIDGKVDFPRQSGQFYFELTIRELIYTIQTANWRVYSYVSRQGKVKNERKER